jgi:hypothetical protein
VWNQRKSKVCGFDNLQRLTAGFTNDRPEDFVTTHQTVERPAESFAIQKSADMGPDDDVVHVRPR